MPSTHAKDMFREKSRRRARLVLLLMAAIIAAATLAPMAVLAG